MKKRRTYLLWLFLGIAFSLISEGMAFGQDPVTLDGALTEWTFLDRLDPAPGQTPPGYEVYGRYESGTYYFAIKTDGTAIGPQTTIWLNTDQDPGTGWLIWGWAGGAEFNINIYPDDSQPYLYTGAAAQNFVSGPLDHAYGNGDTVIEMALPEALMGASIGDIDILMDINDAVFLPGDYAGAPYTLNAFSEWSLLDRLDPAPGQSPAGYELYGHYESGTYYLRIETDGTAIGANTTIWLDTDQDPGTGYPIWGWVGGFDFNINIYSDGQPYLYTGAAAEHYLAGPLVHTYSSGNTIIEMALPEALMGASIGDIDIFMDINDAVYLPGDYANDPPYTLHAQGFPERTDFSKRVGIVFSQTTSDNFFNDKAYAQLFQAMQHQAMMAGIPFVLLTEDDLTDLNNLINLDALIFPYFANVPAADLAQIEATLCDAVYRYQIGIITAGNFMTNDEMGIALSGDPYARSKQLLDIQPIGSWGPVDFAVFAADNTHPVIKDYAANEEILSYTGAWTASYSGMATTPVALASQNIVGVGTFDAVLATETGGRNVHFGSTSMMGDSKLVWPALRWVVYGSQTPVGLQLSRFDSLFLSRTDMDESRFPGEVETVEGSLLDIITAWKADYDFVGSFYINIGNDVSAGEWTDWAVSEPLYQDYLALGNEIGTHSYTHPSDIDLLTDAELAFEFIDSRNEIGTRLGITVEGASVPGNPESLATDLKLDQWFSYVSGTYSNVGSGYPGAFGLLTPAFNNLYFNLNMKPDFTLIEWEGKTSAEAVEAWEQEFNALTFHASTPIIHWLWHDYGATKFRSVYTWEMYDTTLAMAFGANTEFITLANGCDRINAFTAADLTVTENGTITADVAGTGIGQFALSVDSNDVIESVTDWYAYSDRTVFVPRNGGTFTIELGPTPDDRSRIVSLPMRADLISVTGDGTHLECVFEGEGQILASLNIPEGAEPNVQGADSTELNGDTLEMNFDESSVHTAVITYTYDLIMAVDPAEGGATEPVVGIHAKGENEVVPISASANAGYEFSHWTGDVADPGAQSTSVTMDGDKTVTAHFTSITYELTMEADPGEGGTTNPGAGTHTKGWQEVVTITATANSGYVFDHWTGAVADPNSESTTVTMDGDKTVTAHFLPSTYELVVTVDPAEGGTTDPVLGATYNENEVITISATANRGYRFLNWTGDVADPTAQTTTVTMDGNKMVTANFKKNVLTAIYSLLLDDEKGLGSNSHR